MVALVLGEGLDNDTDYPIVFAMAVLKSALFGIADAASAGLSLDRFSINGTKCIVEAKVRQEGYIQWLALMKHREGDIGVNPLQVQQRNNVL